MKSNQDWWTSLKVTYKERIASKIAGRLVQYPECTEIWDGLDDGRKTEIREHCTDRHGYILRDFFEGKPYGD